MRKSLTTILVSGLACLGLLVPTASAVGRTGVVVLTNPTEGATVSGQITMTATATNTPYQVHFSVDGVQYCADGGAPYTCPIDTTTLTNGSHTFRAMGRYRDANIIDDN